MCVFLGLNGWRVRGEEDEVVAIMEGVAAGTVDEARSDRMRRNSLRAQRCVRNDPVRFSSRAAFEFRRE